MNGNDAVFGFALIKTVTDLDAVYKHATPLLLCKNALNGNGGRKYQDRDFQKNSVSEMFSHDWSANSLFLLADSIFRAIQTYHYFVKSAILARNRAGAGMSINKAILILVLLLSAGQGIAGDFPSLGDAYDVNRDAAEDFRRAAVEARKQGKKILIEAGGEWCSWCHILDKYLADNESVRRELLSVFVLLKVNVSPENQNKAFLSRYPPIKGYPAFIIVDHDGNLLGRQNTGKLETRSGYSDSAFLKFIAKWKDKAGDTK